jgi:flagellar motor component MotA
MSYLPPSDIRNKSVLFVSNTVVGTVMGFSKYLINESVKNCQQYNKKKYKRKKQILKRSVKNTTEGNQTKVLSLQLSIAYAPRAWKYTETFSTF